MTLAVIYKPLATSLLATVLMTAVSLSSHAQVLSRFENILFGPSAPVSRVMVEHAAVIGSLSTPAPVIFSQAHDPHHELKSALGYRLFFERRLSGNNLMSCATCHQPAHGLADPVSLSMGIRGRHAARHTPHLNNIGLNEHFFWDGRITDLDIMVLEPIRNPDEMDLPLTELVSKLKQDEYYVNGFNQAFDDGLTLSNIGKALQYFLLSLNSRNSLFDQYLAGDDDAMTQSALRGLMVFSHKAKCTACHSGPNFTDQNFYNIGILTTDPGRGRFKKSVYDQRTFKTPGLRNVVLTAPYMHNGSIPSLREVIEFYNRGGDRRSGAHPAVRELRLSDKQIDDLVEFLKALTDPVRLAEPKKVFETGVVTTAKDF